MKTSNNFLLKSKPILFFKSFVLKKEQLKYSYLLIFASILFSFSAVAQPTFGGAQGPTLLSGTLNQQGSRYLYTDVVVNVNGSTSNADAVITIIELNNITVNSVDTVLGVDNRFEPTTTTTANGGYAEWEIVFVEDGTADAVTNGTPIEVDSYTLQAIDVDGNEFFEALVGDNFFLEAGTSPPSGTCPQGSGVTTNLIGCPTELVVSANGPFTRFQSGSDFASGVHVGRTEYIVSITYSNVSTVRFRNGRSTTGSSRLNSISFLGEVTFVTGTTDPDPTNDPPVVVDNLGHTVLENSGANGPYNVLTGSSDPDGNLDSTTVTLIDPSNASNLGYVGTDLVISGVGIYSVDNTGNVTFTPATNYLGNADVNFRVLDTSAESSNTATLGITVCPVANNTTDSSTICESDTKTLTTTSSGGTWSVISGGGSILGTTYTPADITVSTSVTVRYTIPASAPCAVSTSDVTFTVNPLPSVPTVSTPVEYCVGDTASALTATGTNLLWYTVSTGGTGSATAPTPSTATAGSTSYYVSQTNGNSCESARSEIVVTVNALPIAAVITGPNAVCMGSTIDLTEGTTGTIVWSSSNTGVATIDGSGVVTPVSAGSTDITYTVTDSNGCTSLSSATFAVTVNALPIAAAITGPNAVCMGSTIDLTEGTTGTIVWSSSNTGVATIDGSGVVTPVSAGSTDITYTVTDSNGCTSLSSATFAVTVNALPIAAAITGPNAVCMGSTIDLTEGTTGTIVWSSSNTGVATIDGSGVVTPVSAGSTDITYTVTDSNGCTSLSSATFAVTVNALPIAAAITGPNAVCMGSTIDLTEGTAGTIVWSSSNTGVATIDGSGVVTPVSAGSTDITYTVTDSNGCTSLSSATFAVTVNALPIAAAITGPNAVCMGSTIDLTEGTTGTIVWSSSNTGVATIDGSGVVTPVSAGSTDITYTVTDSNGCTSLSSATFAVTVNALPIAAAITGPNAVCMGSTIDLTEGTTGTIVWSSSNTGVATIDGSGVVTPVSAGSTDITYTVTDSNGCTSLSSATFAVTVNALPIAAAITGPNAVCMGSTIDLTEGTTGTIVWSSSNTGVATIDGSGVVTPVSAGSTDITYTVTDSNGCTSLSSATFAVTVNALPIAAAITGPNAVCMGSTIDLTEGTTGTIVWSSSNTGVATIDGSGVVTPVSAGSTDITYTVTDSNGCTSLSSATFAVTVNALPIAAAITGPNAVCMGSTIDLTEGTAGTIVWSSSNTGVATIDGSGVVTPVSAGSTDITYTVTDSNGCTSLSSATFAVTVNVLPIAAAITGPNAVCMGSTIDLTEGTTGTIVWSSSNTGVATIDGSGVVTPVSAGSTDITYTVTDSNGCTSLSSATFAVTVNALPIAAAITGPNAVCMGSTIDLTEGTAGTIVWSSSNTGVATIDGSGVVTPVSAGSTDITYTVTDSNGCTSLSSATFAVTVNVLPIAAAITGPNAVCMGSTIDLTEGTTGTIVWSSSNTGVATIDGSGVVTPVSAGSTDITYTVTDSNGCTSLSSATFAVTVNALPIAAAITGPNAVCMGSTIDLTEGTTGTIVWSSSNTGVVTIDGSGVVTPVSAGSTDITYTVTDSNGCTSLSSATFAVTVNALPIAAAITGPNAVCMGSTIDLTEGTTGTIVWSSSNTGVATIDGSGVVTPVSAGSTDITYTVTDSNGCTSLSSATFAVTVNALPIAAAITGPNAVCMGSTIDLTEGTTGTIVWSSSNTGVATIDGSGVVTPVSAGSTDITYTVTDSNGCTSLSSATFAVTVNALPIAAAITGPNAVCMGSTIDLTEGTTGTIVWSSSNTGVATIDGSGVVTPVSAGSTDITYTVTDSNGCTSLSSATFAVTVNALPIAAAITGPNAVCMGSTIDLTEGTTGTIVWSSSNTGVATIDGSGVVTPVSAGSTDITYTVTDSNGCTSLSSATFAVTVNALPIAAAITGPNAVCMGSTIDLTEGTAGTIVWSSSNTGVATIDGSGVVTPVSAGSTDITYTVTDSNGCTSLSSATFAVTVNALPIAAAITGPNAVCMGSTIDLTEGTAGTIVWSSSNTGVATIDGSGVVTPVSAGSTDITYTVTDSNGCTSLSSATFAVTVNALPIAAAITGPNAVCMGSTIDLTEGTTGTIVWSSSNTGVATIDGSGVVTPVSAGSTDITYTVTDSNGCTSLSSATFAVTVNALPIAAAITGPNAVCMGSTIDLTEGTTGTIVWSSSNTGVATIDGSGVVTPVSAGSTDITYTVTDSNGCTSLSSATFAVTVNALPIAAAITGPNAVCMGSTIDLTEGTTGTIVWSSSNTGVATIDGSGVVTPVSAGSTDITYTVTDSNGCTSLSSATFAVTVNALPIAAAITGPNAVCMGSTIDLTEGTTGTIVWSSSNTGVATIDGSGVVTPVSAGSTDITYTVTDSNGCTSLSSATFAVTVNALPIAAAITGPNAVCMGSTIDLTEGTTGTIVWSSSNTGVATIDGSGVVTPVSAGSTDITYTVTDSNGCTSLSSATFAVTVNALPIAAAITGPNAVCMGSTIDLTEGTAGTIVWSSSNTGVATIDGSGVVTPVSAGSTDITYTVTDSNGCTSLSSATFAVTVNVLPIAAAITGPNAVCMGSTIDLTEGTTGTIVWSSSNTGVATIDGSGVVTPVSAGSTDITYTVTDSNGCTSLSSATFAVTVNALPIAAAITGPNAVCMGSTIDLTEGTTGTIVWSSSNTGVATIDGSGVVTPVSAGTTDITYTVTDSNGCTSLSSATFAVTVNVLPIAAAITGPNAVCMGSTIDLTEGTTGTIVWSSSNTGVATIDGSGVVTPVSAGSTDITYTVTDSNGCTSLSSATFAVTVNALPIAAAITGPNAVCMGSTIDLTEGTTGTIVWSSSNTGVATIDGSGVVTPVSAGSTDITYTVTDSNGCTSLSSATFAVTVNALPIAAAITGPNAVCMGSTIDLTEGTTGTIVWSSSNTGVATIDGSGVVTPVSAGSTDITYTVTDSNGCTSLSSATFAVTVNALPIAAAITGPNAVCMGSTIDLTEGTTGTIVWSSSNTGVATIDGSGVVTPVSAGSTDITYTVTDSNGCTSLSSATFAVTVNALPIAAAITGPNAVCMGSTIDLTEGTTGTIVWSSSNTGVATIDGSGVVTPVSAGSTDITYTVTDSNGCTSLSSATFAVTVNALPIAAAITGPNAVCMGSTIDLTEGTTGTIVWSSSNTGVATIDGSGVVTPVSAGSTDITYTVTDSNGCTSLSSATFAVTVNALPIAAAITGPNAVCMGSTIDLTEGTAGTIVWSSSNTGVATIDGSGVVTPVSAGSTDITYTVTDSNGCTSLSSATFAVTVNVLPIAAAITGPNAVCMGSTIDLTEGTTGTIVWSSSNTGVATIDGSGVVTPVSAGSTDITYTVTDSNGCTSLSSATFAVTVNALPIAAAITGPNAVCMGSTIDLTEGTAGTIVWSSSNTGVATIDGSGVVTPVSAGSTDITYTVTDSNGCTSLSSATFAVTVNVLPIAAAITGPNAVCMGSTIDLTEGTTGTIVWSSSNTGVATIDGSGVVTPVSAGSTDITYTVTDSNGCTSLSSATFAVTVNALPIAAAITGPNAVCMGSTIDLTEGTTGTIVWSSSNTGVVTIDGSGVVTPVSAGSTDITYTVTDSNGCTSLSSATFEVIVNALPSAPTMTTNTPVCSNSDAVFTITGTPNDVVTYNGSASGNVIIGGTGTVDITISSITAAVTINLVDVANVNCNLNLSISETVTISLIDSDGDGVIDCDESTPSGGGTPTDINDFCSYNPADVTQAPSIAWNNADCDGDGVTNGDELTPPDGESATDPNVSCDFITSDITLIPDAAFLAADCDGDGVTNGDELTPPDGESATDPNVPCDFITNDITLIPDAAFLAADCDGDGVTNGDELTPPDGESATDPNVPCDFITSDITLIPDATFLAADCDGDGVTNGDELTPPDGESATDPNMPCDFITSDITLIPDATFLAADCDGDGVTNGDELTPPDGESATDPNVPCDFITSDITLIPDAAFLAADCDGDGVTNGDELTPPDGESPTDPNVPCDFITSDITLIPDAAFLAADCDGDGVANGDELTPPDGGSPTDPNVPCDFITSDITLIPDATFLAADCDGDGVTNGDELSPPGGEISTDPHDPCSYRPSDITLPVTTTADCTAGLEVTKIANVSGTELGDTITYTIEVENTGNVTLTNVALVDTFTDINGIPLVLTEAPVFDSADLGSLEGTLLVGEIAIYTATFDITQQAINSGGVSNSVIASGDTPSFEIIIDMSDDGDDVDGNTEDDPTETALGCLIVINEFSPNGDGVNEFLIINCIENYPNNRLEIYNRWGNIVYKKQGYRNEFDGTSNGRSTINGTEKLPVGTYYYVLDLADGSKPKVGWLYINR